MATPKPHFVKFMISGIFCLALSIYLLITAYKDKSAFQKITGAVNFISMKYLDLPHRDLSKFRYLKINEYEKPFELFVGKDPGDFKPALDKTDIIKTGDILTIYFSKPDFRSDDALVNRFAYYIDKGNTPLFIFSSAQVQLSWVLMCLSIVVIVIVLVGNLTGRLI